MKIILPLACLDFYTEGLLLRPPAGGQAATVFQHEEFFEECWSRCCARLPAVRQQLFFNMKNSLKSVGVAAAQLVFST
jgi:hypothetical protein